MTTWRGVAQGALEIFNLLPHEVVEPGQLPGLVGKVNMRSSGSFNNLQELSNSIDESDRRRRFQLYSVVLEAKDYCEPIAPGAKFDKAEYYAHPERYRCVFREKVRVRGGGVEGREVCIRQNSHVSLRFFPTRRC